MSALRRGHVHRRKTRTVQKANARQVSALNGNDDAETASIESRLTMWRLDSTASECSWSAAKWTAVRTDCADCSRGTLFPAGSFGLIATVASTLVSGSTLFTAVGRRRWKGFGADSAALAVGASATERRAATVTVFFRTDTTVSATTPTVRWALERTRASSGRHWRRLMASQWPP